MNFSLFQQFNKLKILIIGDIMLDQYWNVNVSRISSEAPISISQFNYSFNKLGGAANVALNLFNLGVNTELFGITGNDLDSEIIINILNKKKIKFSILKSNKLRTIKKLRIFSGNQQIRRIDFDDDLSVISHKSLINKFIKKIKSCDAVLFSDYSKGTLVHCKRLINLIKKQKKLIIVDPKGLDFEKYKNSSFLKPNLNEFEMVVGKIKSNKDFKNKAIKLINKLNLKGLIVTKGKEGISYFDNKKKYFDSPSYSKEVFDVTGAGDTVLAILSLCIVIKMDIENSLKITNLAASSVINNFGTVPINLYELAHRITFIDNRFKIISVSDLKFLFKYFKKNDQKIVMTNGCFDILHAGHVSFLKKSKVLGDKLIIVVNSDDSIRKIKGAKRPINSLRHRMHVLSELECVDWVIDFSETNPRKIYNYFKPDIITKGSDYKINEVVGGKEIVKTGGKVIIIDLLKGISTTSIVKKSKLIKLI